MAKENQEDKMLLPHHEQQALCTTRLPYRQGHKLTAVKVYTINDESAHLLVFNVPSLNLRQELKCLLSKFGKISQLNLLKNYRTEQFTEVHHVLYERIQSARFAKKMVDTKEFYGEILHVCYAPEFESLDETRCKLLQRQFDVLRRLDSLKNQAKLHSDPINTDISNELGIPIENTDYTLINNEIHEIASCSKDNVTENVIKYSSKSKVLNMGYVNTIFVSNTRKRKKVKKEISTLTHTDNKKVTDNIKITDKRTDNEKVIDNIIGTDKSTDNEISNITDIVDCTNVEMVTVTNINESLNYDKFGDEIIRKVYTKPVNKIKYNKKEN